MNPKEIALIIVDMQRDFCKGGQLAVQGADALVKPINRIKRVVQSAGSLVFASRCWHPRESIHFNDFPVHGVKNTRGAEFHPKLDINGVAVVSKGMKSDEQGFSVFDGTSENGNPFEEILKWNGVELLIVCGVALEYCDLATVRDAVTRNYRVLLLDDAVMPFDHTKSPGVFYEMMRMNVGRATTSQAIKAINTFFPSRQGNQYVIS